MITAGPCQVSESYCLIELSGFRARSWRFGADTFG
jgi:hypothetical protein